MVWYDRLLPITGIFAVFNIFGILFHTDMCIKKHERLNDVKQTFGNILNIISFETKPPEFKNTFSKTKCILSYFTG